MGMGCRVVWLLPSNGCPDRSRVASPHSHCSVLSGLRGGEGTSTLSNSCLNSIYQSTAYSRPSPLPLLPSYPACAAHSTQYFSRYTLQRLFVSGHFRTRTDKTNASYVTRCLTSQVQLEYCRSHRLRYYSLGVN